MKTQRLQITVTVPEAETGTTCDKCPLFEVCAHHAEKIEEVDCDNLDLSKWSIVEARIIRKRII